MSTLVRFLQFFSLGTWVGSILFFSAKSLTDEYLTALKAGPFGRPAIFPLARH